MKLKDFFLNCLNRRSFQFMSLCGLWLTVIPICAIAIYSKFIYSGTNFYLDYESAFYMFITEFLPTIGFVTILSQITIYTKLIIKEFLNPEYRLKNKFLTRNPIYGVLAFIFYILALISFSYSLYVIVFILGTEFVSYYKLLFELPTFLYMFLAYVLVNIFLIIVI